ncbi:MAG TPA: methylated-DNA--[protein]-cysteine S-methyltransferase [Ramlibacter sp.]|nr:methylated-DNA--[protein]-cysteine S-methyltransferase [Ramlibacter sp.]
MSDMAARALGFCLFDTVLGSCGIAWGANGLMGVQLPEADGPATRRRMARDFPGVPELEELLAPAQVQAAIGRIRGLLEGSADPLLDIVLDMGDVPEFNQRVYQITRAIPPGRTLTYGEVAVRIGEPGAARAVGQALGHNPFAPVVPCHRVLAARSGSGGFSAAGGVATKLRMLQIEKAQLGPEPGLFD